MGLIQVYEYTLVLKIFLLLYPRQIINSRVGSLGLCKVDF
jgi:hypothetical protein